MRMIVGSKRPTFRLKDLMGKSDLEVVQFLDQVTEATRVWNRTHGKALCPSCGHMHREHHLPMDYKGCSREGCDCKGWEDSE